MWSLSPPGRALVLLAGALPWLRFSTTAADISSTSSFPTSKRDSSTFQASTTTFVDDNLSFQTVEVTELPGTQTPSSSSGSPETTGSVISTLETGGRPPVQPFPTTIPTITVSTLIPLNTTAPFNNATAVQFWNTTTETITVPLTTVETTLVATTIASVPVKTTLTLSSVAVQNQTYTSGGSTVTFSSVGLTVVTTTVTALVETTVSVTRLSTEVVQTTLTVSGTQLDLPRPSTSCSFSLGCDAQNLFLPIAVGQPPANIYRRGGHPVPRKGIGATDSPLETNKFYANLFLGSQGQPAFLLPYSLTWSQGSGNAQSWGLAISHIDYHQKVFGPSNHGIPNSPDSYYINPLGIQSIILSATELDSQTVLTTDSLEAFSANVYLRPRAGDSCFITFPIVQGAAFVTAIYTTLQPTLQSSVFFKNIVASGSPKKGMFKYKVTLEDNTTWLIYATATNGLNPNFQLRSSALLQGLPGWSGIIQVAKLAADGHEPYYDRAAGAYPISAAVSGYSSGSKAQYSLSWGKSGPFANDTSLLMFALPHHIASFDSATQQKVIDVHISTLTKGMATAVVADCWVMEENDLPISLGFGPWRPDDRQYNQTLSTAAMTKLREVAAIEASQNMSAQSSLDSMYFSGKALSKFATLIYTMNDIAKQPQLAAAALAELKAAFAVFVDNRQEFPLFYDTDWKGIVSSASYVTGDQGRDFGNSYYNDHHFHYGYFIHAAAIIGYLDPSWLVANRDYVNSLVRDTSNPSSLDQYFPVFRSFDWYHGHSWAKGLFESGDGKDQESSSEDAMYAYAIKLWGKTVGDASMEARGNLMLAVLTRSFQNYFLMDSNNQNQPANFIGNKVTGILFENKADHTTYFGSNIEYVQGIHMLPVMPFSTLTRSRQFVAEEWATYFADGCPRPAADVAGGWKGVLFANLAIINPSAAYKFFTQDDFTLAWIDGGASRAWYIALSAMLGGSS